MSGPGLIYHIITDAAVANVFYQSLDADARPPEAKLVREILQCWRGRCFTPSGQQLRLNKARSRLQSRWDNMVHRAKTHGTMGRFYVERADGTAVAPTDALRLNAPPPEARQVPPGGRVMTALAKWDWSQFEGVAFLVFERAEARLRTEYPRLEGRPGPELVERLVHREELPTALASNADHYIVLRASEDGGMPSVEFMSVDDAATSGGVPTTSPLRDALNDATTITKVQAVCALGEAVHGEAMRAIITRLQEEGAWPAGHVTVGTAYSGIDVAASAVHAATQGEWSYAFASEPLECRRRVLAKTWAAHGLTDARIHTDAGAPEARRESTVDVYVTTPTCQPFSKRNHARNPEGQARALAHASATLDYVRHASPRIVIMENVDAPELRGHMDMLLLGIAGYTWRSAVIDPRDVGWFAARTRRYWVGVRGAE